MIQMTEGLRVLSKDEDSETVRKDISLQLHALSSKSSWKESEIETESSRNKEMV